MNGDVVFLEESVDQVGSSAPASFLVVLSNAFDEGEHNSTVTWWIWLM